MTNSGSFWHHQRRHFVEPAMTTEGSLGMSIAQAMEQCQSKLGEEVHTIA
jgi:hypothetical protein